MSDIVERLRLYGPHDERSAFRICDEAADEIERLRAELKEERDRPSVRAVYDTALEEAAKLVDDMLMADLGEEIAAAIRALAAQGKEP